MQVTETSIKKIQIDHGSDLQHRISVLVEDLSEGQGKITIDCGTNIWRSYWSAMGASRTTQEFFCSCDPEYLIGCLDPLCEETLEDYGLLRAHAKARLLLHRREETKSTKCARFLWREVELHLYKIVPDLMQEVFGDDWYLAIPTKPNPAFLNLLDVIKITQEAFRSQRSIV